MLTTSRGDMLEAFLRRLHLHGDLAPEERDAILSLDGEIVRVPGRHDLVLPGQAVNHAILVGEGLVGRFDQMRDGQRQITAFHLPGDMCDLHSVVAPVPGWGVTALSPSKVLNVPHRSLLEVATRFPNLALSFWRDATLDGSVLAKWIANLGRRDARARVAHLLCELGVRMERVGLGTRRAYPLDVTQVQIGEAVGLTAVHVNRTLRALRDEARVTVRQHKVEIADWDRLAAIAEFDPTFLLEAAGGPGRRGRS